MITHPTQSSIDRQAGKYQLDQQRENILQAAQTLFLSSGLEKTSMIDIARQAEITRATLYRYFANRDVIAVEVQMRMMEKIRRVLPEEAPPLTLAGHRLWAQAIIRSFEQLRDAYRYIGMFDKVYLDNASESSLAQWTKAQLISGGFGGGRPTTPDPGHPDQPKELGVILSTIIWFLEKLALRGELTWADPAIPLEQHLQFFEGMIMRAFDQIEQQDQ
jgi:AcrR family transcriptional regulator